MASRSISVRSLWRRLSTSSTSGKVLADEERAAENVYMKKAEREKLEKLARKGIKPEAEQVPAPETELKQKPYMEQTTGVSTDKDRNYAVVAGAVAMLSAFGWYRLSKPKKMEEVLD